MRPTINSHTTIARIKRDAPGFFTADVEREIKRAKNPSVPFLTWLFGGSAAFKRRELEGATKLLASLSYRSVLGRGFALVRDVAGKPLRTAAGVAADQPMTVEFSDGSINVREDSGPRQGKLL